MRIITVLPIVVLVTAFALQSLAQQQPAVPLRDIFFGTGEFVLREDAKPVLKANAEILIINPDINIEIVGVCNGDEYTADYTLGRKRAETTKIFLVDLGVEPHRISLSTECDNENGRHDIAPELLEVMSRLDSRVHLKVVLQNKQGFL